MMTKRTLLACGISLAVLGCVTPQTGSTYTERGPAPTNEQAEKAVRGYLSQHLKDPDSIKQFALIYGPAPMQWYRGLINGGGNEQAWLVCFQYNAKNSYGAYGGVSTDGLALRMSGNSAYVLPAVNWIVTDTRCPGM